MNLVTYTNTYPTEMMSTATHPFYKEVDAIAREYEGSHSIVTHAMIAAFVAAYQHHTIVDDPLDPSKKVKIILYLITLAASGEKKSFLTDLLLKPILEHQQKLRDLNQQTPSHDKQLKAVWKIKKDVISSELKAAYKNGCDNADELEQRLQEHIAQEPKAMPPIKFLLEGATAASLKKCLASSSIHPMVCSSEAIAFLKGLDETYVAMLNRAWDGQSMTFETFHHPLDIPNPTLSMSLLTQTAVFIKKIVGKSLMGDSGFWARCLMSVAAPFVPFYTPPNERQDGKAFIERIHEKLRAQLAAPRARHLTLSHTADMQWKHVFNCIKNNVKIPNSKESLTPAFANKMPEHILRLAAVIHLIYEEGDVIDTASIDVATSLVKGFHETQLRLFSQYYCPPQLYSDACQLHEWLLYKRSGYEYTTVHTINKYGPTSSRDLDSLNKQLELLENDRKIYTVKNQKSTEVYSTWQVHYPLPNNQLSVE